MKSFNRVFAGIIILLAIGFAGANLYLSGVFNNDSGRAYRVEINRLQREIEQKGIESVDLDRYSCVKHIEVMNKEEVVTTFFEGSGSDYVIKYIEGRYYRFDYQIRLTDEYRSMRLAVNLVMIIMTFAVLGVLIYVRIKLINPFHKIKNVPYELSKGNLTVGLKESRNRFFGRFVWGLDLLREKLEEQKRKELSLQKEKKTLILSISHDIKTPLSAIKLYAKALLKNLYDSEEKRSEIAVSIGAMADEIEGFVSDIIKASSEDFLNLEVQKGEFYLKELIERLSNHYCEKLALLKVDFKIEPDGNCLIQGDIDRAVEVLQNLMENAIKYGNGKCISITITSEEDCRLVTVTNSGCSLSENELPYIFDSFWRGSNAEKSSGNGLGLYICRQLMKKMDGDIFAECVDEEMRVTAVFRMI
jgi:signal transduction histidine kinase